MQALLNDAPVVSIADYTPDYGEMIGVSIPLEEALPEYYIARARLLSLDGDPLGTPFLYIEGSQQYQAVTEPSDTIRILVVRLAFATISSCGKQHKENCGF